MQRAAFAQKFGAEDHLLCPQASANVLHEADRDGRFDDDRGVRVGRLGGLDHLFDRGGVELVAADIIICRRGDDHIVSARQGLLRIQRGGEVKSARGEERFKFSVDDRRLARVEHLDPFGRDVDRHHLIMLRQQDGIGQADIAESENGDLHSMLFPLHHAKIPASLPFIGMHRRIQRPDVTCPATDAIDLQPFVTRSTRAIFAF